MTDGAPARITLESVRAEDAAVLANLFELYTYDLSAAFPEVTLGRDGRYGYAKLPTYFSEPERRFAYFIRYDNELAGFALATRGSPASDDPAVLDVAEFFVLRRYRRAGVGRVAASLLWRALPGRWTVRVFEGNAEAVPFWRAAIAAAAGRALTLRERTLGGRRWHVFSFEAPAAG